MKNKNYIIILLFLLASLPVLAQTGKINGKIFDDISNEPILFANVIIKGTNIGTTSDLDGNFSFSGVTPGFVTLQASFVGYEMGF
jgi:hypothetical protein